MGYPLARDPTLAACNCYLSMNISVLSIICGTQFDPLVFPPAHDIDPLHLQTRQARCPDSHRNGMEELCCSTWAWIHAKAGSHEHGNGTTQVICE